MGRGSRKGRNNIQTTFRTGLSIIGGRQLTCNIRYENIQRNDALDSATHALSSAVNNSSKGRKVSIALTNSVLIISARPALRGIIEHWNESGPVNIPYAGLS